MIPGNTFNAYSAAPSIDFYGNARKTPTNLAVDAGAIEVGGTSGGGGGGTASATLTPITWTPTQTRNCPGTGLGVLACLGDPSQAFTLTNTGTVNLTGIAQGVLSGANAAADFTVVRLLSTCGPAGGGQLSGIVTLAPGATCVVRVQFKPVTAEAAGAKTATISVTDSAGTQSVIINATAN